MASFTGHQERDTERSEQIRNQPPAADNDVLMLQVRAFLEASEDVDIDVETAEDLMQTIPPDYDAEDDPGGDSDPAGDNDSCDEHESGSGDGTLPEEVLDVSPLYGTGDEAQSWTTEEVKEMMHHLKERGMGSWIQKYVLALNIPIPRLLRAFGITLCEQLQHKKPTTLLYFLKVALSRELRARDRLTQYNTISDAVNLIRSSRRVIILTGAGISVSCGIPDFRSRDGLYATLKDRVEYELNDPQEMFDIDFFRENPAVFYSFARFIKLIEDKNKLLRNYTQNIDTLETLAGVQRVLQCHGSFATASCLLCRRRVPGTEIEDDIMQRRVALCPVCNAPDAAAPTVRKKKKGKKKAKGDWDGTDEDESDAPAYPPGIMKPDITFFGEKLSDEFDRALAEDRDQVDLLLVIGTSLKVSPVAEILSHLPHSVPQILINKTPIRHINPDIVLLGDADIIVQHLCDELGWELPPGPTPKLEPSSAVHASEERKEVLLADPSAAAAHPATPQRVGDSHIWLFDGAEGGRWLQELQRELAAQTPPSLTPLVVDSGRSTRMPSPASAPMPGGEPTAHRKREFFDLSGEERTVKKVKAEQEAL